MIRDFVHLIQNKLRHYAVFPSLHSLSRSSAFQTALFLLGVLAFARACIFLAPPSVTTLASASVNGTFMPICRVETDQKKVALTFNCTYSAQDLNQLLEILKEKKCARHLFRFRRLGKKLSGAALYDSQRRTRYRRSVDNAGISFHPGTDPHTGKSHAAN